MRDSFSSEAQAAIIRSLPHLLLVGVVHWLESEQFSWSLYDSLKSCTFCRTFQPHFATDLRAVCGAGRAWERARSGVAELRGECEQGTHSVSGQFFTEGFILGGQLPPYPIPKLHGLWCQGWEQQGLLVLSMQQNRAFACMGKCELTGVGWRVSKASLHSSAGTTNSLHIPGEGTTFEPTPNTWGGQTCHLGSPCLQ